MKPELSNSKQPADFSTETTIGGRQAGVSIRWTVKPQTDSAIDALNKRLTAEHTRLERKARANTRRLTGRESL
jgi:hypothetical protein